MLELSHIEFSPFDIDGSRLSEYELVKRRVSKLCRVSADEFLDFTIKRRSIDARKKSHVIVQFSVVFSFKDAATEKRAVKQLKSSKLAKHLTEAKQPNFSLPKRMHNPLEQRICVVGGGCAGLFCALTLAKAGLEPLLIERGEDAFARSKTIDAFNEGASLNTESNVQFGMGGAGTYSDGKLTTGTKNEAHRFILETFVKAGAPQNILWDAKPHIGSDLLPGIVQHIANEIEALGGEVKTSTCMRDITIQNRKVTAIVCEKTDNNGIKTLETIPVSHLVLATGHSARDVYRLLHKKEVDLERKTFAMGMRIEHLQKDINQAQYGPRFAESICLGAAPYKLAVHLDSTRSAFSFCMCPGGYVVAATSEENAVVTNGMSLEARAGTNANSGLLANVYPDDLPGSDPLEGILLQESCERRAFELGEGDYKAPAMLVGDFLQQSTSFAEADRVQPTYPRGVTWCNAASCLPSYIADTLRGALPLMDRRLHGFAAQDSVLTAIESRSSSPVRIVRDDSCMSVTYEGLWPAGEGAGYAGGIMSAATDGIRVARGICNYLQND